MPAGGLRRDESLNRLTSHRRGTCASSSRAARRVAGVDTGRVAEGAAVTTRALDARGRREIWAFCYQMLGSPFDADDAAQDTYERAWRSRDRFDPARGNYAAWIFRIARNVCLDRLRSAARRTLPRDLQDPGLEIGAPLVPRLDVPWLQPAPSGWCGGDETAESASRAMDLRLAVTALLQSLPATQRAVFVLREVLGYSAAETGEVLELSTAAVNSSLQRGRAALKGRGVVEERTPSSRRLEQDRVEQFARALEAADAKELERLVTEDLLFEMPPVPAWSRGATAYRAFMDHLFAWRGTRWSTRLTSANHQPALLVSLVTDQGPTPHTLQILDTDVSGRIRHVLVYQDPSLFRLFATATARRDEFEVPGS